MLNPKNKKLFRVNECGGKWKENAVVPSHIKYILDNFLKQIAKGASELLANTNEEDNHITQIPGFMKIVKSINY